MEYKEYKVNLKNLMKENNLSLYKLDGICELSRNTLRKLVNNPSSNITLGSLSILAQTFDCRINDMIEDNPSTIYFEETAEKFKDNLLFSQQAFSPTNIEYLRKLFLQLGAPCVIEPYSLYKNVGIKSEYEWSPVQVDINMRVMEFDGNFTLHVVHFFCQVNQALFNETIIKNTIIVALEKYANNLHFDEIHFTIDQDFERKIDNFSNENSEIAAAFSYTLGTDSSLFEQLGYERSVYRSSEEYQKKFRKTLKIPMG